MLTFYLSLIEGEDDKALFSEFYQRYEKKLYAVALNILHDPTLAEESLHEGFLKIILHFDTFSKIYKKERKEIGPWAVTVIRNTALDLIKKESRSTQLPDDWDTPAREDVTGTAEFRRLVELIMAMPDNYRRALELKFVCEWSDAEIAKELGISLGAAEQRIRRGRILLMQKLKEEGYEQALVQ